MMAVLMVVVRHVLAMFDPRPHWWLDLQALGIFGVLLFFVHTSLVLMASLSKAGRSTQDFKARRWTAFIIRRIFRIYPLSIAVVLLTYFVLVPAADATAAAAGIVDLVHARDLWANLLLVQDLTRSPSILAPLWSLPAEVQMYLLLPLLFYLVERGGIRAIVRVVWPLSVVVAIVAWKLDLRFTVARYAPCFVAGVGCFGLLRRSRPLPFALFPLALFGLLLAYMAAYRRIGLQAGLGIIVTLRGRGDDSALRANAESGPPLDEQEHREVFLWHLPLPHPLHLDRVRQIQSIRGGWVLALLGGVAHGDLGGCLPPH